MVTYFFSFILIGISFTIIYFLNDINDRLDDTSNLKSAISAGISVVISVVNIALKYVVRALSRYEEAETMTSQNLSIALKLTAVRFINTSIVPIIVNI